MRGGQERKNPMFDCATKEILEHEREGGEGKRESSLV